MAFGKIGSAISNAARNTAGAAIGAGTLGIVNPTGQSLPANLVTMYTGGGIAPNGQGWFSQNLIPGLSNKPAGQSGGWQPSVAPYTAPQYSTIATPTGELPAPYTIANPLTGGPDYLQQLDTERQQLANLTSPWVALMRQNIGADYQSQREKAQSSISSQIQQAMETLASRGGARSGARELLAGGGQGQVYKAIQELGRQRGQQLRDVDTKAYETSLGLLEKLPGMQLQKAQYASDIQKANIANMLNERQNAFNAQMDAYKAQMQAWGAQEQGRAMAESAKPGLLGGLTQGLF